MKTNNTDKKPQNGFIAKLIDNQKALIEMFFVSVIGGWVFANLIMKSFRQLDNIDFVATTNLAVFVLLILVGAAIMGVISYFKKPVAKIVLLALVLVYFILTAIKSEQVDFNAASNNPIGQVCLLALMGMLAVAVFYYCREDIFKLAGNYKLSTKALKIVTAVFGILIFGLVAFIGIMRYRTYSNATFDFGIFAQIFEYMKQKGQIATTAERGYMLSHNAVHVSPIFYVALPFYFIFPSQITIAIVQAVLVALPVIPIYLLGKHFELKNKVIVGLVALYAFYPATVAGTFYDIHENTFLTFLLLMFIWAVETKKNIPTAILLILTFMVKEDAPMYVMILGAFWLFSRKDKKRGIIFIAVSAIYFAIALAIINSYGLGALDFRYDNMFYDKSGGLGQIIIVFLTNPAYAINQMISNADATQMDKIGYIISMFAPIGALVFSTGKKYSRYILFGAFVVLSLITTYQYQHDIGFQYNVGHIALFFYIIVMNLAGVSVRKQKTRVWAGVIIAVIMFSGLVYPRAISYSDRYASNKARIVELDKAIDAIPNDASVVTTGFLMPHFSRHLQCYDIGYPQDIKDANGNVTGKKYYENPDYVVIDSVDAKEQTEFDNNYLNSGKYELINEGNAYVKVYKRK